MREFYFKNQDGSIFELSYKTNVLATDVLGLGFTKDVTYLKFSKQYKKAKEDIQVTTISMKLIFLLGYQGYSNFLDYLKRSTELRLYYKAYDLKFCDVEIVELSKGELKNGILESSIKIEKLSLWQKQVAYYIEAKTEVSKKMYPYTYPYTYSVSNKGTIYINNNGSERAPLRIEIDGAVKNPEITISKDGVLISKLKLYVDSDKAKIIVEANPKNQEMSITTDSGKTSIYELQDFNEENFLFLDSGSYLLEFKPGVVSTGDNNTTLKIIVDEFYLGT